LILNEIYDVAGREDKKNKISSKDLIQKIKERDEKRNISREIFYGKNLKETKKILKENMKQGDIVVVMGAGDIYNIAKELL
ncbi:MAG: UDP-N-acetylmuramate--L-alanine ligase, partial [Patescibacteria group bacterium]|nr:UDP-N-acetylmuramate--L-alanine ligase [Patescibacteria group bacterium]